MSRLKTVSKHLGSLNMSGYGDYISLSNDPGLGVGYIGSIWIAVS